MKNLAPEHVLPQQADPGAIPIENLEELGSTLDDPRKPVKMAKR